MKLKNLLILGATLMALGLSHPIISQPMEVSAATSYTVSKTRIGTSDCYWALTSDGTLEITGSGDPVVTNNDCPWRTYRRNILKVEIGDDVKPVSMYGWFYYCENLTAVNFIPDSVTNCSGTFTDCASLVNPPVIPDGVTNCTYMFSGCTNLTQVPEIPTSVTDTSYMFEECTSLKGAVTVPRNVTNIEGMFYESPGIHSIVLCSSPTRYGSYIDSRKSSTLDVNLYYKDDCTEDMANTIASKSSRVNEVVKDGNNYEVLLSQIGTTNCYWSLTKDGTLEITGNGDLEINAYSSADIPWRDYKGSIKEVFIDNNVLPESMAYWFHGCANLAEAPTIPVGVKDCSLMFYNCSSLTQAPTIPDSVTSCNYMFEGCTSLVAAPTIPNSVTNCDCMFSRCTSLVAAPTIPNSVTNCDCMFYNCSSLTQAPEIPNSITSCDYMFYDCSSLTQAPEIPDSVTSCNSMFSGCTSLVEAPEIPNSVIYCSSMFYGCTSLVEAPEIPNSVIYCSQMFEGCDNLRSVYISCNPTSYLRMFEGVGSIDNPLTLYYRGSCTKSIAVELAATGKNVIVKDGNNYEIPIQIGSSNCYWSITSDGVLRITGEGDPGINACYPSCPWLVASDRIYKINISDEVKPISTAFWAYNCKNLVEAPEIPEGVTNCANMFSSCTSLKGSITIPSSVTDCYYMFSNCTNIENVIINSNPIDYTSMFEGAGNINSKVAITMDEDCSEDVIKALANTGSNTYVVTSITSQPKDIQVGLGSDVIFNVRATGLDKKYQWYMADDKISEGKVLKGGLSSEYKLISSDITPELNNKYFYCVITDAYDNTTVSNRAKLTVVTAPTSPTFSAGVTSGSWANRAISLELIGSNLLGDTSNIAYKYSLDGGVTWVDYVDPFTWSTDTTGSTIKAKAYNKLYPTSFSDETNFIIRYDATSPVINNCDIDGKNVTVSAIDSTSGVENYALTTTTAQPQIDDWTTSPIIEVVEYGTYYAWAMDRAGNVSACSEPITVLDTFKYDDFTVCGHTVTYDGQSYQGYVETALDDMVVTYGMTEGVYDLTEAPSFVNAGEYTVYYKIEKEGYESVTGELYVTIHKAQAEGYVSVPDVEYGTEIEPIVNSSTHYDDYTIYYRRAESNDEWSTTKPTEVGAYNAKVVFEESENYVYTEFMELFYINKLDKPSNQPQSNIEVGYVHLKVKDVQLLDGWVWSEKDRDKDLVVGEPITVTAIYTGSDVGNYEDTSCEIVITRLACAHQSTEVRDVVAPTCTGKGYTGDTYCVHCDELLNSGSESSSLGHTWDEGTVVKEPTVSENGLKVFNCVVPDCEGTKEVVLEFGECQHTETVSRNSVEPTCEDKGYTGDDYCTTCGDLIHEGTEVMELGHVWDEGVVSVEPTYKTEGTMLYTCTREGCNSTTTASLEKLLCYHNDVELVNYVDSTCDGTGYTGDTYCKDCDTVISTGEVSEALDHAWDEGTVILEPTYTSEGAMQYVCTREGCDSSRIEAIDAMECEHINTSVSNRVEPTCNASGYSGDVVCDDCSVTVTKGSELPATLKHSYNASNVCTVCGHNNQSATPQPKPQPENPKQENPTEQQKDNSAEIAKAQKVKAKISKLTNKKGKKLQIKVKKQKGYKYEIQVSTSKKFKKSVKKYSTSKTSYTVKKLKQGKKYYVRVRTYKVIDGKRVYGKWSSKKSVKIKK